MAYIAPTTRSTNDLITATIWNADLVDNIKALKDPPSDNYELNEGSNYTTTSASFTDVDATNLALTITTTGGDVLIHFHGVIGTSSGGNYVFLNVDIDGSPVAADDGIIQQVQPSVTPTGSPISFTRLVTGLSAGAHTFKLQWKRTAGTATK
jgi:hypothetical protein